MVSGGKDSNGSGWDELLNQMHEELAANTSKTDLISQAKNAVVICGKTLNELKRSVLDNGFSNKSEEIYFFKQVKPECYGRLLYYQKQYIFEAGKPPTVKGYIDKELTLISSFYEDNRFWYQYYRSGESYLDEILFVRSVQQSMLVSSFDSDPVFTTGSDGIFSQIIAYDLWFNNLMDYLSSHGDRSASPSPTPSLTWTDSKVGLIEICYGLKAKGAFNHGNASLKEITDYLQQVFHVEINNPSRDFQEILRRKTGYTTYLESLKGSYLKYIDAIENKERR